MKWAVVGCGNIAERYAKSAEPHERLRLVGATDVLAERAVAFAAAHGGRAYASLDELLADDEVDAVVNLTAPQAHAQVVRTALSAGKHVHSEKPLALSHAEAQALVELARRRGLRLSCAPATLLGESQQTLWKLVRERAIGPIRAVYSEANWGRIETWHPDPQALLDVGPMVDVGIYPLTILVAMLGPARRVRAYATVLEPQRRTTAGEPFRLATPDWVVAVLELESGVVVRQTASFYVEHYGNQRGMELHGDRGALFLASWAEADSRLERAGPDQPYIAVPLVREPFHGIDWSRPLLELADAIEEGREPRASGELAAHVVEILDAIRTSATDGVDVAIRSSFAPPAPLPWAL